MTARAVAGIALVALTLAAFGASVADAAPAQTGQCPAGAGRIGVRIIVDANATSGAEATCVEVEAGASGYDVLVARAIQLGRTAPRTNGNGLLCAIDGTPDVGCVEEVDGEFRYWSYWTGRADGTVWTYSRIGMDLRRLQAGDVDGWRLVVASSGGPTPRPRRCPDGSSCSGDSVTTTRPTVPSVPPTTGTAAPGSAASGPVSSPDVSVAGTNTNERPPRKRPAAPPAQGSTAEPGAPSGSPGVAPPTISGTVVERLEDPLAPSSDAPGGADGASTGRGGANMDDEPETPSFTVENAAARGRDGQGTGGWVAVGLVGAAGALAIIQARRTRLRR